MLVGVAAAGGWIKLRNVSLILLANSQLQLVFSSKSKVQEPGAALIRSLEDNIEQRTALAHIAPQQQKQRQQQQHTSCTLNLLPGPPFTPLRCVRSAAAVAGKYRVLCRLVSVWPADFRRWTHLCCGRCGDRTHCAEAVEVEPGSHSGGSGCRACGGLDSRRSEWGFSLVLEDATALLQAEVWGEQAVRAHALLPLRTSSRAAAHSCWLMRSLPGALCVVVLVSAGSATARSARRRLACERSDAAITPSPNRISARLSSAVRLLAVGVESAPSVIRVAAAAIQQLTPSTSSSGSAPRHAAVGWQSQQQQ